MATIEHTLNHPIRDGETIDFIATCDSSAAAGLQVTYPVDEDGTRETKTFTFRDAHGNDISSQSDIFSSGAYVKVLVDTTSLYAYIQNADTNGYLEEKLGNAAQLDSSGKVKAEQASAGRTDITESSTLSLNHAGKFVLVISDEDVTVTIPAESTVAWPHLTEIEICQWGAGSVTIAGASGVGIVSLESAKTIAGQFGCVALKKTGGDTWLLAGALA